MRVHRHVGWHSFACVSVGIIIIIIIVILMIIMIIDYVSPIF